MDTGIVISYIIGGILLLAILFMNLNVGQSSTELTLRQMTQQNVSTASEIFSHDMQKIGFDKFRKITDPISVADSNRIQFQSNIDNSGSTEIVEWYFDPSATASSSTHPNSRTLKRIIGTNNIDLNVGVTSFELTYYDSTLSEIPTPISSQSARNDIRHIAVEMTVSSKEEMGTTGGGSKYVQSPFRKIFTPKNIANN